MHQLKKILRIVLYTLSGGIVLIGLLILIFYKDIEESISQKLITYMEEIPYGTMEVESLELDLFQHFPHIGLNINELKYFDEVSDSLSNIPSTLLSLERLSLSFNSWDLAMKNTLEINGVLIEKGSVNLIILEEGDTNFDRAIRGISTDRKHFKQTGLYAHKPQTNESASIVGLPFVSKNNDLIVSIEDIEVEELEFNFKDSKNDFNNSIFFQSIDGQTQIDEFNIAFALESKFEITKCIPYEVFANQGVSQLTIDLDYSKQNSTLQIYKGILKFAGIDIHLSGHYEHLRNNYLDLSFDAASDDMAYLSKIIKPSHLNSNSELLNQGDIILSGTIKGELKNSSPEMNIKFGVDNLNLNLPHSAKAFRQVGFDGVLTNEAGNDLSNASIKVSNLTGQLPGGHLSGDFSIHNFDAPYVRSNIDFEIDINQLDKVLSIPQIDSLGGVISFSSNFDGPLDFEANRDILEKSSWSLSFSNVSCRMLHTKAIISNLNGSLNEANRQITINELGLVYNTSDVKINAIVNDFYDFVLDDNAALNAKIQVQSDQLLTKELLFNSDLVATIDDRISELDIQTEVLLTKNTFKTSGMPSMSVALKQLSFKLDSLPDFKTVTGNFELKDTLEGLMIDADDVQLQMQEGHLYLEGLVSFPPDYRGMHINTTHQIKDFPEDYIWELINAFSNTTAVGSKFKSPEELSRLNGAMAVKYNMIFNPFSMDSTDLQASKISLQTADTESYVFNDINFTLDSLYFKHKVNSNSIEGIETITGKLEMASYSTPVLKNDHSKVAFTGRDDMMEIVFISNHDAAQRREGALSLNIQDSIPQYTFQYQLNQMDIKSLLEEYHASFEVEGQTDVMIDLEAAGNDWDQIQQTLNGMIHVEADSLSISGIDLDDLLRKYKRSQNFNLADVSALVLAGPVGAAVTKGSDFTSLISTNFEPDDETKVSKALLKWQLDNGTLKTNDVAIATYLNRIAFDGSIDLVNDSIPGFSVYVIDKKGCSLMEQTIYGSTSDLQMGKVKIAKTLLGSVTNLLNAVLGNDCEVVYDGEVSHPENE